MNCIELKNISKTYSLASSPAVQGINLNISEKEKVGLIGANGSGKTTLMRLIMNFVIPDEGKILIQSKSDLEKNRRFIGFVPEHQEGMENFTPRELLHFSARMHNLNRREIDLRVEDMLGFAELATVADELLSDFSKGMVQRVQICIALMHKPKILLLDEPMSGLDISGQKSIREILLKLTDTTLVYASHNLTEIETLCTSVVIIHQGRIVKHINIDEIHQEIFTIDLDSQVLEVVKQFKKPEIQILYQDSTKLQIQFTANSDVCQKFISDLHDRQIEIKRLRSRSVLEEFYHQYVVST